MLPGATVTLSGPDEARVTQSDGNGNYAFEAARWGLFDNGRVVRVLGRDPRGDRRRGRARQRLRPSHCPSRASATRSSSPRRGPRSGSSTHRSPHRWCQPRRWRPTASSNVGDVLRSVPGVNMISSLGALVDGRSIYLNFFGLVMRDLLPANQARDLPGLRRATPSWATRGATCDISANLFGPHGSPAAPSSRSTRRVASVGDVAAPPARRRSFASR